MSQQLNVAKKYVIEYDTSGWFNHGGTYALHHMFDILGIGYNSQTDYPEFETDFEVERTEVLKGVETLKAIDREEPTDVDIDDLTEALDNESMTLNELIQCFEFIVNKSDKKNDTILISFF